MPVWIPRLVKGPQGREEEARPQGAVLHPPLLPLPQQWCSPLGSQKKVKFPGFLSRHHHNQNRYPLQPPPPPSLSDCTLARRGASGPRLLDTQDKPPLNIPLRGGLDFLLAVSMHAPLATPPRPGRTARTCSTASRLGLPIFIPASGSMSLACSSPASQRGDHHRRTTPIAAGPCQRNSNLTGFPTKAAFWQAAKPAQSLWAMVQERNNQRSPGHPQEVAATPPVAKQALVAQSS